MIATVIEPSVVKPNDIALTTSDNPFDPFEEFDDWFNFDVIENNYNSCSLLSRLAFTSEGLSEKENAIEKEKAIDQIIKEIPLNSSNENAFYVKAIKGKTKFPLKNTKN